MEKTNLLKNDFVLAIQTSLQVELMKICGPNKLICIDATHGTNVYNFTLITIVVVDDLERDIQRLGVSLTKLT